VGEDMRALQKEGFPCGIAGNNEGMVLRSTPPLILMGKKSVKSRKEKMPACFEE